MINQAIPTDSLCYGRTIISMSREHLVFGEFSLSSILFVPTLLFSTALATLCRSCNIRWTVHCHFLFNLNPSFLLFLIEPCFKKAQGVTDSSNAYAVIVVKRCSSRVEMDVIRSCVDLGPLFAHTGLCFRLTRGSCISSYNPGFSSHKTECAPLGAVVDF